MALNSLRMFVVATGTQNKRPPRDVTQARSITMIALALRLGLAALMLCIPWTVASAQQSYDAGEQIRRMRQAAAAVESGGRELKRMGEELDSERARVLLTNVVRELNRDTIQRLEREIADMYSQLQQKQAAFSLLQKEHEQAPKLAGIPIGCAFRRLRPLIPVDRDHLFRSIATSVARVLVAPLDVVVDVSLPRVGQARQEAVPVVNRKDPRATRSALTAEAAARVGGPC